MSSNKPNTSSARRASTSRVPSTTNTIQPKAPTNKRPVTRQATKGAPAASSQGAVSKFPRSTNPRDGTPPTLQTPPATSPSTPGKKLPSDRTPQFSREGSSTSLASNNSRTSVASEPKQPLKIIFHVDNLPPKYSTQQSFYGLLTQLAIPFDDLKVYRGAKATIISTNPCVKTKIRELADLLKEIKITFYAPKGKERQTPRSSPTFSVVVRGVDMDIGPREFTDALERLGYSATGQWRIISRRTNEHTTLVRIITRDPSTLDYMLTHGIRLYGRVFRCEPSLSPGPVPLQCSRCYKFGHQTTHCNAPFSCPRCGQQHSPSTNCKTEETICLNCSGKHPAYSAKCPNRPKEVSKPEDVAPIRIIDPPTSEVASDPQQLSPDEFVRIDDAVRFITNILTNAMPLQSELILAQVRSASRLFFRREVKFSQAGTKMHCTIVGI